MTDTSYNCSRCGKECKDKRGLSVHEASCKKNKNFHCPHCSILFACNTTLVRHIPVCSVKMQNDIKKEIEDKEQERRIQYENTIKQLKEENQILQSSFSKRESDFLNEKEFLIRQTDYNIKTIEQEKKKTEEELNISKSQLEETIKETKVLRERLDQAFIESKQDKNKIVEFATEAIKHNQQTNVQYNGTYNNNSTNYNLQLFDTQVLNKVVDPPNIVFGDIDQLMSILLRKGIKNQYRISDHSRDIAVWNNSSTIKDKGCVQLSQHIVDNMKDDIDIMTIFWNQKLLEAANKNDTYNIIEYKNSKDFCIKLKEKDSIIMKDLQHRLVRQGKDIKDKSIDIVKDISYTKLVIEMQNRLVDIIEEWIYKDLYNIGKSIGNKLKDLYWKEGASDNNETRYIVVRDDDNYNKQIFSDKFGEILQQTFRGYLTKETNEQFVLQLLRSNISLRFTDKIQREESIRNTFEFIDLLNNPDDFKTDEILHGMIDTKK